MLGWTYDERDKIGYVSLTDRTIVRTIDLVEKCDAIVDVDDDGHPVGVELLGWYDTADLAWRLADVLEHLAVR